MLVNSDHTTLKRLPARDGRMTKPRAICVYCGSSDLGPQAHREAATRFGHILAENAIDLVFGGGRVGLMGLIADATLGAGGRVIGIIPDHLLKAEVGHGRVSELLVVDSMHVRKETMFRRSDAFVILPGGPGTLDETFEILTWRQLRLHDKPVVICNVEGYWDPLIELIDKLIAARYAAPAFRGFYRVVKRVEDILPAVLAARPPELVAHPERM
jgi:uncharacterized protein (TIGR00730 family)